MCIASAGAFVPASISFMKQSGGQDDIRKSRAGMWLAIQAFSFNRSTTSRKAVATAGKQTF